MPSARRLSGVWRGRLVDVQGFEGVLELTIESGAAGRLRGSYNVEIATTHSTMRQQGEVHGSYSQKGLSLAFASKEPPIEIRLAGDVLDLRDRGVGMRGVYEVSARTFSPLQGGVISAAKDQRPDVDIASKRDATKAPRAGGSR
jgi:hypothetical protein